MPVLIRIKIKKGFLFVGKKQIKLQNANKQGCNVQYKKWFWCPEEKWFFLNPCMCDTYIECQKLKYRMNDNVIQTEQNF